VLPSVPEGAAGGLLTGAAAAFGAVELFELFFFGLAALSAFFFADFVVVLESPLTWSPVCCVVRARTVSLRATSSETASKAMYKLFALFILGLSLRLRRLIHLPHIRIEGLRRTADDFMCAVRVFPGGMGA